MNGIKRARHACCRRGIALGMALLAGSLAAGCGGAAGRLTFWVRDAHGHPLADVAVKAGSATCTTDRGGRCRLQPSGGTVTLSAFGFVSATVTPSAGGSGDVHVTLQDAALFPVGVGSQWTYAETYVATGGAHRKQTVTERVQAGSPPFISYPSGDHPQNTAFSAGFPPGSHPFLAVANNGAILVNAPGASRPEQTAWPRTLQVGQNWVATSPGGDRYAFSTVRADASVSTPAGTFTGVFVVHLRATDRAGGVLEQDDYYVKPGIGVVEHDVVGTERPEKDLLTAYTLY